MTLEVASEAPVATNLDECTLDDPALGQPPEARHVVTLDNLEAPGAGLFLQSKFSITNTDLSKAPMIHSGHKIIWNRDFGLMRQNTISSNFVFLMQWRQFSVFY